MFLKFIQIHRQLTFYWYDFHWKFDNFIDCYSLVNDQDGIELENIDVSEDEKMLHPSYEIGVNGSSETKSSKCSFFSSQLRRLKDTFMPSGKGIGQSSVTKNIDRC